MSQIISDTCKYLIGIPTYRGVSRLPLALQSARLLTQSQIYADPIYDILVVDDGSPINEQLEIVSICRKFKANVICLPINKGLPNAYNILLNSGKGRHVVLMDDDVLVPSNLLSVLSILFTMNKIGVAGFVSKKTSKEEMQLMIEKKSIPVTGEFRQPEFATELAGQCFCINAVVESLKVSFSEVYKYYIQDSDFCCQLAVNGLPSFRFHWPNIMHLEHGTLGEYAELKANEQVSLDIEAFKKKWGMLPKEREQMFTGSMRFKPIVCHDKRGYSEQVPCYNGEDLK